MARNRTVWPEFWGDAKLARVSRDSRLTFIGMWNFADDYGVIKANADWLRANIFEGDETVTIAMVKKWCAELESIQVILSFTAADEKTYYYIRTWDSYQRVDKKSKRRFPEPPPLDSLLSRESPASIVRESRESPDVVSSDLRSQISDLRSQISLSVEQARPASDNIIQEIFAYWQTELNHTQSKLDAKREKAIKARLKEGYSVDRIKQAIRGIKKCPHNMGQNDRNTVYDDLELICRSGSNVDRFADMEGTHGKRKSVVEEWCDERGIDLGCVRKGDGDLRGMLPALSAGKK